MFKWTHENGQAFLTITKHAETDFVRKFPKDQIREFNGDYVLLHNGYGFNSEGQKILVPFLSNIVKTRIKQEKNNLMLVTGEASSGKSYLGLSLCEYFDPKFNVDKVIFTPKQFFDTVLNLPKNSWVLLDEPAQALSHREWYSDINKCITWTVESFRFRLIHMVFTAINPSLIDKVLRDYLLHFLLVMKTRGHAQIYQYAPSPFNPETRTPYLGEIMTELPSKQLRQDYEEKRKQVQLDRYYGYSMQVQAKQQKRLTFSEQYQILAEDKASLLNKDGEVSIPKIMLKVACGRSKAYEFMKLLQEE